jgi:hypothetical protein
VRVAERRRVGTDADPSAAIMEAQSVKTVEESGRIRGYDAHNTNVSKVVSAIRWWIRWVCPSLGTSRQRMCTPRLAHAASWQD